MISIRRVHTDDAVAVGLWTQQQAELRALYIDEELEPDEEDSFARKIDATTVFGSFVGSAEDGEGVASSVLQWPDDELPLGSIEAKRLFVRPEYRRRGYSRVMMGAVESEARRSGATSVVLGTGTEQVAAMALYGAIGYHQIEPYGEYAEYETTVCFAKDLPTRVLVVNGTIGAGKTTTAAAVFDALMARGSRAAFIDGDYLCQAEPSHAEDPFNQALLFDNLAAMAPNYRARGYGLMVIARVVEDPEDRARYATAFASAAGPADVSIIRVDASQEVREARVSVREPEGKWRDWALARTVELSDSLDELDLDDAVISTEERTSAEAAGDVLDAAGWA
ncbi:GNAT family N-acetyltransferase [Demequina aurantiaca]|uniref:GNAT family N-acetyltransferase n=1 Tax=Demequina aurantiaca TaxID=676200 RepID=UPI003D34AFF8